MKQTKKWLMVAAVLLCSVTRSMAEMTFWIDYKYGSLRGTSTISTNEEGTQQGEYTSEVISCSEPFNTITLTCLNNTEGGGGFDDPSGYPFITFAEFYLYDGEGNEIPLTAENFSTNAQEPTGGPIENICDGDRTTSFHSMWTVGAGEHHKLMITLPEGKELKEFKFKYITRWMMRDVLREFRITTDKGSLIIPKGNCGENLTYTLSHDGHLEISGSGAMYDRYGFSGIGSITKVTIPEGVTSIGVSAFAGCSSLTSITIPESVTSIGEYAFSSCSSLTAITIPESVTSIGSNAFAYCSSLTSIVVEAGNTVYDSRNNCNAIIETNTNALVVGCSTTQIPSSVTSIGEAAFRGCSSLTSITIPESVTSIGEYAFSYCSSLTSITIPESVTSIGDHAFAGCSSLNSITIPESVTSIGDYAFWNCSSLTSITIPESVTSIGGSAFSGCTGELYLNANIPSRDNSWDRWFLGSEFSKVTIGDNVTSIGNYAFSDCSTITSIIIPEGVVSIGSSAFSGCSGLTSITIPASVTSIGGSAFGGCTADLFINCNIPSYSKTSSAFAGCKSSKVTIGDNVNSIGDFAFYNCKSIESIIIPEGVIEIGSDAFTGTTWYDNIEDGVVYINKVLYVYKGTMPENTTIKVKEGTITISKSAFSGNKTLTAITLPSSITEIGEGAFKNCSNLNSYDIPANARLTSIGKEAFSGCKALTALVIPAKVTEIAARAFYNCTGLTSITCYAKVPPTVDTSRSASTFSKVDTTIPLYVPIGSEAAYQSADGWKDFSNIIGVDTGIENLEVTVGNSNPQAIYDLSGRRVEDYTKNGIYIVNGKKIIIK